MGRAGSYGSAYNSRTSFVRAKNSGVRSPPHQLSSCQGLTAFFSTVAAASQRRRLAPVAVSRLLQPIGARSTAGIRPVADGTRVQSSAFLVHRSTYAARLAGVSPVAPPGSRIVRTAAVHAG